MYQYNKRKGDQNIFYTALTTIDLFISAIHFNIDTRMEITCFRANREITHTDVHICCIASWTKNEKNCHQIPVNILLTCVELKKKKERSQSGITQTPVL